jgi:aminoglycoside phosphotransferase family enzyme/predicted kinase
MELAGLIEVLAKPAAYPYPVETIEVRQTHISVVFLAGQFVYKIKKPVNPGFLDFTTLEKRRHFCAEEVRLNQRLAPHVYLGVVPIVQSLDAIRIDSGDAVGDVIEWAVKMQRLPDEATLLELIQRDEISVEMIEELARRIAAFHRTAERNERIAAFGRYEIVSRLVLDILEQAAKQVGTTVGPALFRRVKHLAEEALVRLRPLIESRAARGLARDCHGDLHLDHVYCFPGREPPADLVIIDCIEFNERFRFSDALADMAFPAMDLAYRGRRDLARAFAEAYFQAAGDAEGRALLPLYAAYRAIVRGTVEGLLLGEREAPDAQRAAALVQAHAHWLLALTELEDARHKPCLILVAGLPGAGKSTLARGLAERGGFHVVRSDVVRKELTGVPAGAPTPLPLRDALYSPEWNERTYGECLRLAERLLAERCRRTFLEAAVRWGVPGGMLICTAKPETVHERLLKRQQDASDADWSIHQQVAEEWEEACPATRRVMFFISMDEDLEPAVVRASEIIEKLSVGAAG